MNLPDANPLLQIGDGDLIQFKCWSLACRSEGSVAPGAAKAGSRAAEAASQQNWFAEIGGAKEPRILGNAGFASLKVRLREGPGNYRRRKRSWSRDSAFLSEVARPNEGDCFGCGTTHDESA